MSDDKENQLEMFRRDEILAKEFLSINEDNYEDALVAACQAINRLQAEKFNLQKLVSTGFTREACQKQK